MIKNNLRSGLIFLIMPLLIAAMACSLTGDEEDNAPTAVPTQNVIGQQNTVAATTSTPRPTTTTLPPLNPTPSCSLRTDFPTYIVQSGDTLFGIAQKTNSTVNQLVQSNCLGDANAITAGQVLYVPNVPAPPTVTPVGGSGSTGGSTGGTSGTGNCTTSWFFTFNSTVTENRCPGQVITSKAAGEDFEGGRVYWYEASGIFAQNVIYVIFNDGGWSVYGDTWDNSQPFNDPSIIPPQGRYQPVAGIGKLWRTQPGLRDKLGWAFEPERAFTGRRQEPILPSDSTVYDLYIDHGVRNVVLRLRRPLVGNGQFTWIVAGTY